MAEPCECSQNLRLGEYDGPVDSCITHGVEAKPITAKFSEAEMVIVVDALEQMSPASDDFDEAHRIMRRLVSNHFRRSQ